MLSPFILVMLAYLLGSLPFGVWGGRALIGRDIRAGGSGHSGATNTLRQAGWGAGALVLILDLAKGFAAEWLALRYGDSGWLTAILAGAAVVAGHCWPLFAGFRGGMGLATAGGVLLAVYPLGLAIGLGLVIAAMLGLRHAARGSVVAGVLIGPALWLITRSSPIALIGLALGLVVAARFFADWGRQYRELWLDRGTKDEG